jgi:hypothetical protein
VRRILFLSPAFPPTTIPVEIFYFVLLAAESGVGAQPSAATYFEYAMAQGAHSKIGIGQFQCELVPQRTKEGWWSHLKPNSFFGIRQKFNCSGLSTPDEPGDLRLEVRGKLAGIAQRLQLQKFTEHLGVCQPEGHGLSRGKVFEYWIIVMVEATPSKWPMIADESSASGVFTDANAEQRSARCAKGLYLRTSS